MNWTAMGKKNKHKLFEQGLDGRTSCYSSRNMSSSLALTSY